MCRKLPAQLQVAAQLQAAYTTAALEFLNSIRCQIHVLFLAATVISYLLNEALTSASQQTGSRNDLLALLTCKELKLKILFYGACYLY